MTVLDDIHAHALAEYPREACGLVVVIKGREVYRPCRNTSSKPGEHFALSAEDYAAAEDAGEIVRVVHSHPDESANPSEGDRVACEASGLPWQIVAVHKVDGQPVIIGSAQIAPSGYQAPYVGRQWQHGTLDCWALCRDWYAREMGITLPNPERHDEWWDDGHSDLYSDGALADAGFVPATLDDIARGDMILMQIRSKNLVPNHAAIYLGDGQMLHHLHGRLSSRDVFGGYWLENLRKIVRNKDAK